MNYQKWDGFTDSRFGYGAMLDGFVNHVPKDVTLVEKASTAVHMGVPFSCKGWWAGSYRVLYSMWETTALPSSFARYLPLYDMVIVPNQCDAEVFGQHHRNVHVVPLGVDRNEYKPLTVPRNPRFQFRAGGSLWGRKGLDVVVAAFNKLGLPDADLRIKAAPHASDVPKTDLGPNIYLDRQWMSHADKCRWFAEADCFIAASRGEGFGLMPLQTIAMGIPTIVSLTTGQIQFAHLATGTVSCTKSQSPHVGKWDEPNVDELCEQMLHHYRHRDVVTSSAQANIHKVDEFSWDNAVQKLLTVVPQGRELSTSSWQDATVYHKVRAIKPVDAHIGNRRVRLEKDQIVEITDGEYQVLYDAGAVVMA